MRVHHLNCGSMYGMGLKPLNGTGGYIRPGLAVIHCLLVETNAGLLLVDTGWGLDAYFRPTPFERIFRWIVRSLDDPGESAIRQVERLGYRAADVTDIVVTHLHLDHAGGLRDFPAARVHVYTEEHRIATCDRTFYEGAHRPVHWAHGPDWVLHDHGGDAWFGYASTPPFTIGGLELRLIPTPGHSRGHCLVAIRLKTGWLVHAGDAYFYHGQVDPHHPHLPPGGAVARRLFRVSGIARAMYQYADGLVTLRREVGDSLQIFCTHDPHEYEYFASEEPVGRS